MKKVILISGKQGSGKTTVAAMVADRLKDAGHSVYRMKFADPLYELHDVIWKRMARWGIQGFVGKDGQLLQLLGTDWGRKRFGQDVWVTVAKNRIENYATALNDFIVIDDCRFPNELAAFPDALSIRLECSKEVRRERCESWRDSDEHESETALDAHLDKFTKVISTEHIDVASVADLVMELL